ncbi:MAG TPA: hypothetical protein VKY27_06450 [Bacteriovoracaceae bacterium]|nr:hypothetical protein [Bacteriovoracaceae bacterium]
MDFNATDMVGYLASLLLMISFTLKKLTTLRVVNTLGCTFFVIYGLMLSVAWPIVITNGFIVLVNLYHLSKEFKSK